MIRVLKTKEVSFSVIQKHFEEVFLTGEYICASLGLQGKRGLNLYEKELKYCYESPLSHAAVSDQG